MESTDKKERQVHCKPVNSVIHIMHVVIIINHVHVAIWKFTNKQFKIKVKLLYELVNFHSHTLQIFYHIQALALCMQYTADRFHNRQQEIN